MTVIIEILVRVAFQILEKLPEWAVGKLLDKIGKRKVVPPSLTDVRLYSPTCGEKGIDLAQQRLLVSLAFGAYFAGLLEREHSYVALRGQIECPAMKGQEALDPLERILWAVHYPRGPRLVIIVAEGGMGKSTLAAKIVRCLYEEQVIDMILGDSAKTQRVEPVTGKIIPLEPGYYDLATFHKRVCGQLGLPPLSGRQAIVAIRDRLEGRRALIVVDNLETVTKGDELLRSLEAITSGNVRAIMTSRDAKGLKDLTADSLVVHLKPLSDLAVVQEFLAWHIRQYQDEHPGLRALEQDLDDGKRIQWLVKRTGGIPLLIQLVFSDIARFSWDYLQKLPYIFGNELLAFLYQSKWHELETMGTEGSTAREILHWIAGEQYRGRKVAFEHLKEWAHEKGRADLLAGSLRLLHERFLIVNHDPKQGNFAIFPSLVEFLQHQSQGEG